MKALVIGATGATGKDLVNALSEDQNTTEVHAFVRKSLKHSSAKVKFHTVDFSQPESWANLVEGDVAFSCLGTTLKDAGSKENQRVVDFDYQLKFAQTARENGVEQFILLSAYGANPDSKIFYSKMKGELELEVEKLGFESLTIFRPGILKRENTGRFVEKITSSVLSALNSAGILKSQKPIPTKVLARAMLNAARVNKAGKTVYSLGEIFKLADNKS